MRFSSICLLALPALAVAKPAPWQVSVTVEDGRSPAALEKVLSSGPIDDGNDDDVEIWHTGEVFDPLSKKIPTFDDSRIKNHPDRLLLKRIRKFFKTFTTGDFDGMKDLQSEDYTMTDIPIGVIRASRDQWYEINKAFISIMQGLNVIAVTLDGTSAPGGFSILEHVVKFQLVNDPPPEAIPNLPAGAKGGDWVGMVNLSVLYWDEEGNMSREYEYGRLSWKEFDVTQFDKKTAKVLEELKR